MIYEFIYGLGSYIILTLIALMVLGIIFYLGNQ